MARDRAARVRTARSPHERRSRLRRYDGPRPPADGGPAVSAMSLDRLPGPGIPW